jgi:hypothetical protein
VLDYPKGLDCLFGCLFILVIVIVVWLSVAAPISAIVFSAITWVVFLVITCFSFLVSGRFVRWFGFAVSGICRFVLVAIGAGIITVPLAVATAFTLIAAFFLASFFALQGVR